MLEKKKVVLGLSGGVDSAVSARLLMERGFEVHGLFLNIGSEAAKQDAISVAEYLKIPLEIVDIAAELDEQVCTPFAQAYLRGETPNPCIICNPNVKFKTLLSFADKIGASHIATGHYAKAENGGLFKGEPANDQSYMLCRIKKEQLDRVIFPLGGLEKEQVRELAEKMALPVAHKPDSMEICFIPDGDYAAFIETRGQMPPEGQFVDSSGAGLGQHKGIHHYTIGQRRGLGIAVGKRIFVSEIRPETNEVVLSDGEELHVSRIHVGDVNWLVSPDGSFKANVRVRHSKVETPATVIPEGDGALVEFEKPVRAPTKGQTAAFYDGDRVVGGGFIL